MSVAHELCRGRKRLLALVEYALAEGWTITRTVGGHLLFSKPGLPPLFTSSTARDHRVEQNAKAQFRHLQDHGPGDSSGI